MTVLEQRIAKMKRTGVVYLTGMQRFVYFGGVLVLLLFPAGLLYRIIETFFSDDDLPMPTFSQQFWWGYIWIIAAVIIFIRQKQNLKFIFIDIHPEDGTFKTAVEHTANELKWAYQFVTPDLVLAKSGTTWRSWGEHITILRTEKGILFNSICDPDKSSSVISFGTNHNNKFVFEKKLHACSEHSTTAVIS